MRRALQPLILSPALLVLACGAPSSPGPAPGKIEPPATAPAKEGSVATRTAQNDSAKPLPVGVKVHREEVSDTPIKTQVSVDLLVSEGLGEAELRQLLEQVHAEVSRRTGFRYHPKATHVAIRTFATAEHADSGMGQWSAQLLRLGVNAEPKIMMAAPVTKERKLSEVVAALPEETRRQVWREAVLAEDRATKETQSLPLETGLERSRELTRQYKVKVAEKYGLSEKQLREIELEGLAKNWPFPKF